MNTQQLRISESAHHALYRTLMWRPPETGAILLGPEDSNVITFAHFDASGSRSVVTYSPDCNTLSQLMQDVWLPQGLDMKGFAHSHPGHVDSLSTGDLIYINRLLQINPDMDVFAAPLVVPAMFQLFPYVVCRHDTRRPVLAELVIF